MANFTTPSIATRSVVAVFNDHTAAEEAVRLLTRSGVPARAISIIGKDWQAREDVQGYYQPADAIKEGAETGAWVGGLFGVLMGIGLFILPVGGAIIVLGPVAGLIAGAVGGLGVGALVGALVSVGIPKEQALKYQVRLEAGEFLVIVHGSTDDIERAHQVLHNSSQIDLQVHETAPA